MLLHPAHNEAHFTHVDAAGHAAAQRLTPIFQEHARSKGLPAELVDQLHVRYDSVSGEMRPGVKDARFRGALDEWDYGTLDRGPTGVVSTFLSGYADTAVEYYGDAIFSALHGVMN